MRSEDNEKDSFRAYLRKNRKTLKEASLALFITIITSVLAGIFLGTYRDVLLATPGLIVLIPGILSMRGTIQGAMGSRLGSAFHLGLIKKASITDMIVRQNLVAAALLSAYLSIILAVYSTILSVVFGIGTLGFTSLVSISFIGTMASTAILLTLTFFILFRAYSHGWDIDTIHAPIVASFGDFVTIPVMLFTAIMLSRIVSYHFFMALAIIAVIIMTFLYVKGAAHEFKRIIKESLPILSLSAILSASSGIILQDSLHKLAKIPAILALIPAFIGEGGNIGSVFASRISTQLHLGLVKPKFEIDGEAESEISHTYLFGLFVFPAIGFLTYVIAKFSGLAAGLNPMLLIFVSLVAGALLTSIIVLSSFGLSIIAYKRAIDPDNILIPVVAGLADILGVACLFIVLYLMGVL